jgi:hypothetical protein
MLLKGNEEKLSSFERKILRKIHGSVYNLDLEVFERRRNDGLQILYSYPRICQSIRGKRIECAVHVWWVVGCFIKNVMLERPLERLRPKWFNTVRRVQNK